VRHITNGEIAERCIKQNKKPKPRDVRFTLVDINRNQKMPRIKDCPILKKYGPLPVARTAYKNKKRDAKERDIEFNLTFLEYYEWFLSNGVDKNIPQKNDKNAWCMCRTNDVGPYSIENIYLDTMSNNSTTGNFNMHHVKKIEINYNTGVNHPRYKGKEQK